MPHRVPGVDQPRCVRGRVEPVAQRGHEPAVPGQRPAGRGQGGCRGVRRGCGGTDHPGQGGRAHREDGDRGDRDPGPHPAPPAHGAHPVGHRGVVEVGQLGGPGQHLEPGRQRRLGHPEPGGQGRQVDTGHPLLHLLGGRSSNQRSTTAARSARVRVASAAASSVAAAASAGETHHGVPDVPLSTPSRPTRRRRWARTSPSTPPPRARPRASRSRAPASLPASRNATGSRSRQSSATRTVNPGSGSPGARRGTEPP